MLVGGTFLVIILAALHVISLFMGIGTHDPDIHGVKSNQSETDPREYRL